jgi:hypothetical protein
MDKSKEVKSFNEHLYTVQSDELNKLLPTVLELKSILEHQGVKSLQDFEEKVNQQTGWHSVRLSCEALGLLDEWNKMQHLEKIIDDRLSVDDLEQNGTIKKSVFKALKEKHTVYYSKEELASEKAVESVLESFNSLADNVRRKLVISTSGKLIRSPFYNML